METITAAMIAYCVLFAGLVLGISVYRGIRRKRAIRAFADAQGSAPGFTTNSLAQSSAQSDSPHDSPSAKHAA